MYTIFFSPSASLLLPLQRAEWYLRGLFYKISDSGLMAPNPIFSLRPALKCLLTIDWFVTYPIRREDLR